MFDRGGFSFPPNAAFSLSFRAHASFEAPFPRLNYPDSTSPGTSPAIPQKVSRKSTRAFSNELIPPSFPTTIELLCPFLFFPLPNNPPPPPDRPPPPFSPPLLRSHSLDEGRLTFRFFSVTDLFFCFPFHVFSRLPIRLYVRTVTAPLLSFLRY